MRRLLSYLLCRIEIYLSTPADSPEKVTCVDLGYIRPDYRRIKE
ncbi:hypothetical protein [uncultured Alistipes sp.]|jgi:hypothetical protein|nr:hypothetical protein [uncultured Alistipes sp.]